MTLFKGPNGDTSSKRVAALICFAVGIVKTFYEPDIAFVSFWIGAGAGLLTVGAITKS